MSVFGSGDTGAVSSEKKFGSIREPRLGDQGGTLARAGAQVGAALAKSL